MITFMGCEGQWLATTSPPSCSGQLQVFTAQEIVQTQQLSTEDYLAMKDHVLSLFLLVFGFVALKKLL